QAVADRQCGVLDVQEVTPETHGTQPITRAVERGLKLRSCRVSRARWMWKTTRRANTPRSAAAHRQRSTRTPPSPAGKRTIHTAVPMRFTKASGTRYFQHMSIIWSTRMRGSVQRSHTATNTQKYDLRKKVKNWSGMRSAGAPSSANGICQPPRKSVVTTAPITYRFPHSAMKKSRFRMPLYSVAKPMTSSDSASGRSNGVRFPSASAATKKMKKARKVNGFPNRNQRQGAAPCAATIDRMLSEPES